MAISILIGIMRSGKGIGAAHIAYNHAVAGYLLISNMPFFFNNNPEKQTSKPLDYDVIERAVNEAKPLTQLYSAKKILVVIDELMLNMDNRKSLSNSNTGLSYFAAQAAKTQTSILGTSQLNMAFDLRMRGFAQKYIYCDKELYSTIYKGQVIHNAISAFNYFVYDNQTLIQRLEEAWQITPEQAYWLGQRFKTEALLPPKTYTKKTTS